MLQHIKALQEKQANIENRLQEVESKLSDMLPNQNETVMHADEQPEPKLPNPPSSTNMSTVKNDLPATINLSLMKKRKKENIV